MSKIFLATLLILTFLSSGCARHQNMNIPISKYERSEQYYLGKIESKHSKELEKFIRNKYRTLLSANETLPTINIHFIHLNTKKPSMGEIFATAFAFGFIGRDYSVDVRCLLQVVHDNKIISESESEGTGKVESWGYFAAFREQDKNWAIDPAELEAEKRAFSSAIDKIINN